MRPLRRRSALLLVAGLVGLAFPSAATATDSEPVSVRVGALLDSRPSYEFASFYPAEIQVHRGQRVDWGFEGFHTVTFLPGDVPSNHPSIWRADEVPGTFGVEEKWFLPVGGCGIDDQAPCTIDDTNEFVSSGVAAITGAESFSATIDLPAGRYRYHCNVHPGMHGFINVVPDAQPLDNATPEEIDAQIDADLAAGDAVVAANSEPQFDVVGNKRVWRVKVGVETADRRVLILQYLPGNLPALRPGDDVVFQVDSDIHTVTFPAETQDAGFGMLGIIPGCDPDGPATGAPGFPLIPPICPPGTNLEARPAPWLTEAQPAPGNAVATPATYHNSAIMTRPSDPAWFSRRTGGTSAAWPDSFRATFPAPGQFSFACSIHGAIMTGGIGVV